MLNRFAKANGGRSCGPTRSPDPMLPTVEGTVVQQPYGVQPVIPMGTVVQQPYAAQPHM